MKENYLYFYILALLSFYFFLIPILSKPLRIQEYSLPVPAIVNDTGVLSTFEIKSIPGSGTLYLSNIPIKDYLTQISFEFARLTSCIFFNCYKKDYILKVDTNTAYIEGPSGSSAAFILISSTLLNKTPKKIPVTGFIIPNGIILPVGGINQKFLVSEEKYGNLVLPYLENFDKGIKAKNALNLLKIYFNYNLKEKNNSKEYKEYLRIIKEIAYDICNKTNSTEALRFLKEGHYYTAASLCFIEIAKENKIKMNITKEEIKEFINKVKEISCNNYICEEIKYNVLERAYDALNSNGTYSYWRFYTAKQWLKFINITSDRKTRCGFYRDLFNVMNAYYSLELGKELELKDYNCLGYKISTFPSFLILEYKYGGNATKLLDVLWNTTEEYLKYFGFSIAAYNYLQYSKDLYKMNDTKSAIYYGTLALLYAMP